MVLGVIDCVLLELLLIDLQVLHDLLQLGVDDLLFFLRHLDDELLVRLLIVDDGTPVADELFLPIGKF